MKERSFLIPSLLAVGFVLPAHGSDGFNVSSVISKKIEDTNTVSEMLFHPFSLNTFLGHRSHRSHSSHSSHRSSSGGSYGGSSVYSPPPPPPTRTSSKPYPLFSKPTAVETDDAVDTQIAEPFVEVVKKVQSALKSYGYYEGDVDGDIGPLTKVAIEKMQTDYGLKVTGTITPEVLSSLNIKVE